MADVLTPAELDDKIDAIIAERKTLAVDFRAMEVDKNGDTRLYVSPAEVLRLAKEHGVAVSVEIGGKDIPSRLHCTLPSGARVIGGAKQENDSEAPKQLIPTTVPSKDDKPVDDQPADVEAINA